MKYTPVFTEKEQEIRHRWRTFLSVTFIMTAFNLIFLLPTAIAENTRIPEARFMQTLVFVTVAILATFLISFYWVAYHSAYKKSGTKFLIFQLISAPIATIYGIYYYLFTDNLIQTLHPTPIAINIAGYLVSVLFYISTYQLLKINRRIQLEKKSVIAQESQIT